MNSHLFARLFSPPRRDREIDRATLQKRLEREQGLRLEFARRHPDIPLVQHRTGEDDSVLGTACFADLEARPARIVPTDHPAVTFVELAFRYSDEFERVFEVNLGKLRLFARIEDPLHIDRRRHTVEQVRARKALRTAYFRKVFAMLKAQSDCAAGLAAWMKSFLLADPAGSDRDLLATLQSFNHNILIRRRRTSGRRDAFLAALRGFEFDDPAMAPGPVSLRLSVRPHRREDGCHLQSMTTVLLGHARGLAFNPGNGRADFVAPGNPFERRFSRHLREVAGERLDRLSRPSWRRNAQERIWGGPDECEAYFHNHDTFRMKGLQWTLQRDSQGIPEVLGTHRNVAAYRSGPHRVAVKAVPFETAGDLVRLVQAHQYVHGVQSPALLAQAMAAPKLADDVLGAAIGMLSDTEQTTLDVASQARKLFDTDWSDHFRRCLGPLLHQVRIDYEHKLLLAVLEWSEAGMLGDAHARQRLIEDCSLSHRLRMAANLFRNGYLMLDDDVTHTDLKPENILNKPGLAHAAVEKARMQGWQRLDDEDLEKLQAGESTFEGDFSGIHFGRAGAIDNLSRGEGLPTTIRYSSWKFTSLGLSEGSRPMVLRRQGGQLPGIDELLLEQDIANRGTSAWEIVYGSLVDCVPPVAEKDRLRALQVARERLAEPLDRVVRLRRENREDREAVRELERAMEQCDSRLLDLVSLRSETVEGKARLTPLFQQPCDNRNGLAVWLDSRVIELLDHMVCDFRRQQLTRSRVSKLYRTAEALLRAEAGRLESADRATASNRRLKMVAYMRAHRLHFNPDCGLLGLPELPCQLEELVELVERVSDPRAALREFTESWLHARRWGANVRDALDHLRQSVESSADPIGEVGRRELFELIRSTLLEEHAKLQRLESRADEALIRPPHLGLFENRVPRVRREGGALEFTHTTRDRAVSASIDLCGPRPENRGP